jgi:hypothetical protein
MNADYKQYMNAWRDGGGELVLADVVARYPWFITARALLSAETGAPDRTLDLHLQYYPLPTPFMRKVGLADFGIEPEPIEQAKPIEPETHTEETAIAIEDTDNDRDTAKHIIDSFLASGEHKIVPDDKRADEDVAGSSAVFDLNDDLVSEELAEIYLNQGLKKEAKAIYRKLSLLYPKKSSYFAEIIDGIK